MASDGRHHAAVVGVAAAAAAVELVLGDKAARVLAGLRASVVADAREVPKVQQVAVSIAAARLLLLGELHHAREGRLAVKQRQALAGLGVFTVLGEVLSGRRSAAAEKERRGGWRLRTKHGGGRPEDDGMTWSNCTAYSLNRSDENPGSIGVLPACVRDENVKITLFKKCHQNRTEVYIQD